MPQTAIKLTSANLALLGIEVLIPSYDRHQVVPHTVHIGVGSFHRAHQALYLDDLLAMPDTERWGECGLGVLASDVRMRDALHSQDYLYTLAERSADKQTARVIGSIVDYVQAPETREAAIEKMAAPETRIVSLTITEGGYFIDEATGEFLVHHSSIQHDLENSGAPSSSIGLIAEALDRRRLRGLAPFTVMSCDNLQGNGHVISKVLRAYSGLRKPELETWIAANVAFPNSMVDRITPATTPTDIAWLATRFGIEDAWPVVTEPFLQWVIEDTFSSGRPQWERVGAQFTTDVTSYEIMKMRLLNGSHLAMAYLGALAGFAYVQDIMADPVFVTFIERFMEEVTPVVPVIPNTSIPEYKKSLIERFSNPTINDQVTRICSEGSAKIPKWLLPSIQELLDRQMPIDLLSLVVASWIFYLGAKIDQSGKRLDIVDARAGELSKIASEAGPDPTPILAVQSIFSQRLFANRTFQQKTAEALSMLHNKGVIQTMQRYLNSGK
jgi:mannitol 2-dehydrogenase